MSENRKNLTPVKRTPVNRKVNDLQQLTRLNTSYFLDEFYSPKRQLVTFDIYVGHRSCWGGAAIVTMD